MRVLNKGYKDVPVKVPDRYGGTYTIYISPNRETELDPTQVSKDLISLISCGKLIQISNEPITKLEHEEPKVIEIDLTEEVIEDVVEEVDEPDTAEVSSETEEVIVEDNKSETIVEESDKEEGFFDKDTEEEMKAKDIYKCKICGYEAATLRGLKSHMSRSHKNEE